MNTNFYSYLVWWPNQPNSGRVDRASATEAIDSASILGRVKPKTIIIGIHRFDVQQLKGQCEASAACVRQVGRYQFDSKTYSLFTISWPRQLGE